MDFTISNRQFKNKPTAEEVKDIHSTMSYADIDIVTLAEAIEHGQTISPAIFKRGTTNHTCANFKKACCMIIDIDHTTVTPDEIGSIMKYTLAYPSFNDGLHILICFNGSINNCDDFKSYVNGIIGLLEHNGIKNIDHTCNQAQRIYYGTNKPVVFGNGYYTMEELNLIRDKYAASIDIKKSKTIKSSTKAKKCLKTAKNSLKIKLNNPNTKVDYKMVNKLFGDAKKLNDSDMLYKYNNIFQFITHTTTDKLAERLPYYTIERNRRWDKEKKEFKKYKHNNHRRSIMFRILTIIQQIKMNITFEELLYNAIIERMQIFDNSDNKMSDKWLYSVCMAVYNRKDFNMETSKTRVVTNKQKCAELGISYQKAAAEYRFQEKAQEVLSVYDWSLTIKQNLDILRESGMSISMSTLSKIIKPYKQQNDKKTAKIEFIKNHYDFKKTQTWNLKFLAENGMPISKVTLIKYLREITKRKKWNAAYRPKKRKVRVSKINPRVYEIAA